MTQTDPAPRRPMPPEAEITVAHPPLVIATAICTGVAVVAILALAPLMADPGQFSTFGALGAAGAGVLTTATARLFASGKPRPASSVGSAWLGATLMRFVLVPALCVSVYFAAPKVAWAAVLATLGSYLGCLAVETAMVVRQVHRGS